MRKTVLGIVVFSSLACAVMVNVAVAVGIAGGPGHVIESLLWGAYFWGIVSVAGVIGIAGVNQ